MNQNNFDQNTFNMMLNMMNVMYPNMGYDSNNYKMDINNQNLMNLMMNWMNMNPNLLFMYQNMMNQNCNNVNNNQMNFMGVQQSRNNGPQVSGGGKLIPNNIPNNICYDVSPNDACPKINVAFTTQKGQKMMIVCPYNMKIKDLLAHYVLRLGLGPNILNNDLLFFLLNGNKINKNENTSVGNFGLNSGSNIIVLDLKDVIGS